ncbi:CLUMA_CG007786, isoform A [Clunio marinus]|uniref:CLUMA_CG007786, isoform A n=1 Tax=Clunio marinus TaxID=568069 RepID=A0A1J1I1Q5_9DIPT|nr:CLUMA_CG007786, isoform A [Clunio marinus]
MPRILFPVLVVLIAIQGSYAAICSRELRTGQYQNFDSLEDMYASNTEGGLTFLQDLSSCITVIVKTMSIIEVNR